MDEKVVLLDDISTTGSSLFWGTHNLLEAGAEIVISIVLGLSYKQRQSVNTLNDPEETVSTKI
jgi:hypothetical protein